MVASFGFEKSKDFFVPRIDGSFWQEGMPKSVRSSSFGNIVETGQTLAIQWFPVNGEIETYELLKSLRNSVSTSENSTLKLAFDTVFHPSHKEAFQTLHQSNLELYSKYRKKADGSSESPSLTVETGDSEIARSYIAEEGKERISASEKEAPDSLDGFSEGSKGKWILLLFCTIVGAGLFKVLRR